MGPVLYGIYWNTPLFHFLTLKNGSSHRPYWSGVHILGRVITVIPRGPAKRTMSLKYDAIGNAVLGTL
jgi:hypothetical protein